MNEEKEFIAINNKYNLGIIKIERAVNDCYILFKHLLAESKISRSKIRRNRKGEAYFLRFDKRIKLRDCLRV